MKPQMFSREEEAELARSNKKVKDWHHADFNDGSNDDSSPLDSMGHWSTTKTSFRDKLVGAIPRAYAKAFDFADQMDKDMEFDDENAKANILHQEGTVAVKLTKETKLRIRRPWSKDIIVNLVGRLVSFNYVQSKLTQIWRPSGRMYCVDLTYGFFLV